MTVVSAMPGPSQNFVQAKHPAERRGRRTQEARSAETRGKLLDAAIECLIERGYARTTTTLVGERAGLSRGAQLHHFRTKAELLTSAVEHLAGRRAEELRREAESHAAYVDRASAAVDLLWSSFSGRLFEAVLELWVAARTDEELRDALLPLERKAGRSMTTFCRDLFGEDLSSRPGFAGAMQLTIHLMRGMALAGTLKEDDTRERELLESWKWMVKQLLEAPTRG